MKKYFVGFIAITMALSAVALPKIHTSGDLFYWYKRTGLNSYVPDGQGANPQVSCPNGSNICAKGFHVSHDPSSIQDATLGDTPDRKKN